MSITELLPLYFDKVSNIKLSLSVIIIYSIIDICIYLGRAIIIYKAKKDQHDLSRSKWSFTLGHVINQFIISYIIGWTIIILTSAKDHVNLFVTFIIAPFVGFVLSVYIDHKFILPLDSIYNKKNTSSKSSQQNGSSNNITVNVNSNLDNMQLEKKTIIDTIQLLDSSLIESDDFDNVMVNTINSIIESQKQQCEELHDQSEKIKNNTKTLELLRDGEMIDKKVELKKMIYDCLNNGFATPIENDKITQYYLLYKKLGGNHEVETLYNEHYLKLQVHEDRRKNNNFENYNGEEKRNINRKTYSYGELDNE